MFFRLFSKRKFCPRFFPEYRFFAAPDFVILNRKFSVNNRIFDFFTAHKRRFSVFEAIQLLFLSLRHGEPPSLQGLVLNC